jgi:hypothetical protein
LNPLIQSDAAALNQVDTDAEVLQEFIQKSYTLPQMGFLNAYDYYWSFETVRNLFMELFGFQKRLANHLSSEIFIHLSDIIDGFFYVWLEWQRTGTLNRIVIHKHLAVIRNILKNVIFDRSRVFLAALEEMGITCPNTAFQEINAVQVKSPYQS